MIFFWPECLKKNVMTSLILKLHLKTINQRQPLDRLRGPTFQIQVRHSLQEYKISGGKSILELNLDFFSINWRAAIIQIKFFRNPS